MLDIKTALENIYSVARLIYDQVQLVQANKEQCVRLGERVKIIEESVRGLSKIENMDNYKKGLNDLLEKLKSCLEFMKQFSEASTWFRWILKAGTYQEKFQQLNEDLQKCMQQLSLGLVAQQIINREQDKRDQQMDAMFIRNNQARIIELNKKGLEEIQALKLEEKDRHEVLLLQLASIKAKVADLAQPKPSQGNALEKFSIPFHELRFERLINAGSYGKVYLGKWEEQTVAIKLLEGTLSEAEKQQFIREVAITSGLRHPNIISFYGACLDGDRACIVMEYMREGDLSAVLRKGSLPLERQKELALDIAKALSYLHSHHFLHRDVKSANILVDKGTAKLADFGLSKTNAASVKTTHERSQALQYQAPECFARKGHYTEASDVYSFGVVLWEIATGQSAKLLQGNLMDYAYKGERESIPKEVPAELAEIIRSCWQTEASMRPSMKTIIGKLEAYQPRPSSPTGEEYYLEGQTKEKQREFTSAFQCYQKSANKGYFKAKTNMGNFYLQGISGPADKSKAYQLFLEAAKEGHERAIFNLATMLEYGDGIQRDVGAALTWYQKIAARNLDAQRKCEKLKTFLQSSPAYQMDSNKH